ncbi:hypothetical protein EUGRSUZ_A02335 [Eucalyptus grandis]|uniref:Uncharacterized protein n=2 Tax=Eucalyptus grandis TaxID=71139 RepID=A0ACC3M662_EUCGR|nr:hypothetical protein EUGRSUZ_A02335 [Eucalyptus grandis]
MMSQQEDAKLGASVAIWVQHVERLGVAAPNHTLELRPHVQQLAVNAGVGLLPSSASNGITPAPTDMDRTVLSTCRSDSVHSREAAYPHLRPLQYMPRRAVGGVVGLLALEGDADKARGHLLDKGGGGDGELEEEDGFGLGAVLDRKGYGAAAVAKEGAGDFAAKGGRGGGGGGGGEGEEAAGGGGGRDEGLEPEGGEEAEEGAEEGADPNGADGCSRRSGGVAEEDLVVAGVGGGHIFTVGERRRPWRWRVPWSREGRGRSDSSGASVAAAAAVSLEIEFL